MATELINLDLLIPPEQYIVFRGVKHVVVPVSADAYLKIIQSRKILERQSESEDYIGVAQSIELLCFAVPSIPKEEIQKLPITALTALAQAIEKSMDSMMRDAGGVDDAINDEGELTSSS